MDQAPKYTYLDTSSLMRRAEGQARTVSPRNVLICGLLDNMFANPGRVFACSELTILEYHGRLTGHLRSTEKPDCDYDWWLLARQLLFSEIATGRVIVLRTPPKAMEHAMTLVTVATREHGRAFGAWDAMHLVIATRWAYVLDAKVELLTSDAHFDTAVVVNNPSNRVTVSNLDVLASTGEGLDARNR